MRYAVTIYLNSTLLPATRADAESWEPPPVERILGGYQPDDRLTKSWSFFHEGDAGEFMPACDAAFALFNADDRPNPNERSLSVGDVVRVQDENGHAHWYACEPISWRRIDEPTCTDKYGNTWPLAPSEEFCPTCGQPDNCGDCNHTELPPDLVRELGGKPPSCQSCGHDLPWPNRKCMFCPPMFPTTHAGFSGLRDSHSV